MKLNKVIGLVILSIFTIASLSYAYTAMVNLAPEQDTPAGAARVETAVADEQKPIDAANADDTRGKGDKGSPLHAWIAIAANGKNAGDIITTKEFEGLRKRWSTATRGYELQSLVAIGVLSRNDADGNSLPIGTYRVVVSATQGQINDINEQAKGVVKKTGRNGEALGIDSYRLDAKYIGLDKLGQIVDVVKSVTGVTTATAAEAVEDLVQADINAGIALPASVAINGDMSFTVNGITLQSKGVTDTAEQQAVLAALIDMRLLSDEAKTQDNVADFESAKVRTVLFKGEFVAQNPDAFAREFKNLEEDQIAVIISTSENEMEPEIKAALGKDSVGLLGEWGNRIIVMGVQPGSPAAVAFANLFKDSPILTDFDTAKKILDNKDAIEGLAGAV